MTARLIRPFHVRLDVRTGKAEISRPRTAADNGGGAPRILPEEKNGAGVRGSAPVPPSATNLDNGGSIKVLRDDMTAAEERREPSLSPLKSADGGSIKVARDDRVVAEERREPSFSPLKSSEDRSIKIQRDDETIADERREPSLSPLKRSDDNTGIDERRDASFSPPPKTSEDDPAEVIRRDKIVIEDLEREHQFRTALASSVEAGNRMAHRNEHLDTGTIIRIAAAVIVVGLGSAALLPSILTRNPVGPTVTLTTPPAPVAPAQTEQAIATQPTAEPRPDPLPTAAPPVPAPASNNTASVAKAAPALRGSSPPDVQGEPRATTPSAGKADGGIALTAAEKAAITRGLQELEKTAAVTTPSRSASARPRLTDEEKAAVERGLRELEKTAGQAKP